MIVAAAALVAGLWLLLFIGPQLLNAHRDDAAIAALLLYLGVPSGLAWGGSWLWSIFDPKDHFDD